MQKHSDITGWLFGFSAFLWWGLAPIYFKALESVAASEILAHRIAWCVPTTLVLMLLIKKRINVKSIILDKKIIGGLFLSTVLISINWYIFTWAVTNQQILATSLGYFINPILSILLGVVLLGERLTKMQWLAVLFAALGVANQVFNYGEIPWIALGLATSFAFYGLIKKKLHVDSVNGFLVETSIAFPFALTFILWAQLNAEVSFMRQSTTIDWLLVAGGLVTAVPLMLFSIAAKKIPLSAMGFLQFLAPSITFVLATQVYSEPLSQAQLTSFIFIWIGLGLYLVKPIKAALGRKK